MLTWIQPRRCAQLLIVFVTIVCPCLCVDNGLGITPPRGWRSWDAFLNSATQAKQELQVDALVKRHDTTGNGPKKSLLDMGYNRIGLDDSWQDCGAGVNGSFHNASGWPLIKNSTFPSMAAMNKYAREKGIGSGWYLNSCDCCERGKLQPNWDLQMRGDVAAIVDLGFDGIKLDSCGPSQNLHEWARLLNASGKPVLIENCFDNASFPYVPSGADDGNETIPEEACPMNMFRAGGDMRADWPLMLRRLQTIAPWLRLSRPKCWAYLDMLEVGHPPGGTGEARSFANTQSWRAHFGAWAITSSPLILSFDLSNETLLNMTWDFIANPEVLRVNSDWAGEAGRLLSSTYDTSAPTPSFARPCTSSLDTQHFVLHPNGQIRSLAPGDGRCLSVPSCPTTTTNDERTSAQSSGTLLLTTCDGSDSQQWSFIGDPTDGDTTTIRSKANQGCWEVNGCSGTTVDTNFGCKKMPKHVPCPAGHACDCNMAFTFLSNGSITSGIPDASTGQAQCIRVSEKDESTIRLGPCTGSKREIFTVKNGTIRGIGGGCVDNNGKKPLHPQYGPLVLSDCNQSKCNGDEHKWELLPNGQLRSAVSGVEEHLCAEVQAYQNHNAQLSSVGCSSDGNKAQVFRYDPRHHRLSIDVRFDSRQQRSPGMLLCADIDFSATPSGNIKPGSKLLDQVWSKRVSNNATAVLFLNAEMTATAPSKSKKMSVDLKTIGVGPGYHVRDLWARKDLDPVGHNADKFAVQVPSQDSVFLLFSPPPTHNKDTPKDKKTHEPDNTSQAQTFSTSELQILLSRDQMHAWGVDWPDAALNAVKHGAKGGYTFFMEGGSNAVNDIPGTPWTVMTSGNSTQHPETTLKVQELLASNVAVSGYPCPSAPPGHPPFDPPCVRLPQSSDGLQAAPCNSSSPSQRWTLRRDLLSSDFAVDSGDVVAVQSAATSKGGCWEINGCSGSDVDTSYGCKALPAHFPCQTGHECNCNMAWKMEAVNSTDYTSQVRFVSGILASNGQQQCLKVVADGEVKVKPCTGDMSEHFSLEMVEGQPGEYMVRASSSRASASHLCIDNDSPLTKSSTVGQWVSNVYDISDGALHGKEVLAFIHLELRVSEAPICYFKQGLAYSSDGGQTFRWCGYFASPHLTFEHSTESSKYGRPNWFANMGLSPYIIKDGYIYSYFADTNDLSASGKVVNVTGIPNSAGNPDQGVAVVRASLTSVVQAARQHSVVLWRKYHEGEWNQPALGGPFTPLNLPVQGYMHGDAAFCAPLKKWVIVTQSGGRIEQTELWRKRILISFSSDGIEWEEWQTVWTDDQHQQQVVYPSIMSYGADNEVVGTTFAVVFQYRNVSAPFQFAFVNVTVNV